MSAANTHIKVVKPEESTRRCQPWTFAGSTPKSFAQHIKSSVPFYEQGHDLVSELSDFFVRSNSVCYELGSSVGTLINKLAHHHSDKPNVRWIGVDSVSEMVQEAKGKTSCPQVTFIESDINDLTLENSDLIISYYTMQFVSPVHRQNVINKIYNSLNWGGAFICFEKVRANDARFQDYMSQIYTEFKIKNGHSAQEILDKSTSLKSVLEPFSTQGNIDLFKRAGFVDIMTVMKWVCFEGFLCIK